MLGKLVLHLPENMLLIVLMVVQLLHWCYWWAGYAIYPTSCSLWPGTPATFSCPEYRVFPGRFLDTPSWPRPLESKDRGQTAGPQAAHERFRYSLATDSPWFDERRPPGSLVVLHGVQQLSPTLGIAIPNVGDNCSARSDYLHGHGVGCQAADTGPGYCWVTDSRWFDERRPLRSLVVSPHFTRTAGRAAAPSRQEVEAMRDHR